MLSHFIVRACPEFRLYARRKRPAPAKVTYGACSYKCRQRAKDSVVFDPSGKRNSADRVRDIAFLIANSIPGAGAPRAPAPKSESPEMIGEFIDRLCAGKTDSTSAAASAATPARIERTAEDAYKSFGVAFRGMIDEIVEMRVDLTDVNRKLGGRRRLSAAVHSSDRAAYRAAPDASRGQARSSGSRT